MLTRLFNTVDYILLFHCDNKMKIKVSQVHNTIDWCSMPQWVPAERGRHGRVSESARGRRFPRLGLRHRDSCVLPDVPCDVTCNHSDYRISTYTGFPLRLHNAVYSIFVRFLNNRFRSLIQHEEIQIGNGTINTYAAISLTKTCRASWKLCVLKMLIRYVRRCRWNKQNTFVVLKTQKTSAIKRSVTYQTVSKYMQISHNLLDTYIYAYFVHSNGLTTWIIVWISLISVMICGK